MTKRIEILVNQEDVQNIINCYEKDIEYIKQLETNINTAIDFIDQVLQYHLSPFDYKQVDEDINTLIGILRSDSNE